MLMRRLVAALLVSAALACGGDDSITVPTNASVAGTWTLQSVNGSPLPFVIVQSGSNKSELTADVLTVGSSGNFTQLTTIRNTLNGQVTTQSTPDAGTYTLNGTAATFRFNSDGSTGTGAINGNTLTVADVGLVMVYQRQ